MKVISSIRRVYDERKEILIVFKDFIDNFIKSKISDKQWFYFSRIKEPISFALKSETGRFKDLANMEDFFAGTIVVENSTKIEDAKSLLLKDFDVIYEKPYKKEIEKRKSNTFAFDDLRMYVKLKKDEKYKVDELFNDILFEIQIKTFLQHAWSIASHDLIYKTDDINWGKERIAFQIKAMLENAENSIKEADSLSKIYEANSANLEISELNYIKKFLKLKWNTTELPQDLLRLAKNISRLCYELKINLTELEQWIDEETNVGKGTLIKDLSPYLIIIQTIINKANDRISNINKLRGNFCLLLPPEIDTKGIIVNDDKCIKLSDTPS